MAERVGRRPQIIVGKDTRLSSDMLEAAVSEGLCSIGADAVEIGVVPTPVLSFLVNKQKADAGIMLSASYKPYEYNGIKIFGLNGLRFSDIKEQKIEVIVFDNIKSYSNCWGCGAGEN